ncbi:hypothetical protein K7X08_025572 [Anisodus acutangulus]|uniref:Uncharacterized protein n=1 Tax=Anisodus acutangulus TaxID=402998 RepID=A0A9Q1LVI2_9SOLA|nr:hypothetical protein K7X08_025572 [Anisodus acutangulus]
MQTTMDSLEYNWKTPNENAKIFQQEPEQVVGAAPVYFASEEEAIGVEHLLAEPETTFKEFSALESVLTKSDHDAVQRGLNEEDKTNEKVYYPCEQFLDGLSYGYDENYCSISWEDYPLDIELEEESPTVHDVTRDISYKNFIFPKCSLDGENERAKVPPASCENLLTASTAFASIFNFRRKPRVQRVKRREHIQWNSFKWDSKELAEENVKCDGTKLGISEQRYYRGAKVSSQGLGKGNSQVGCVQLPPRLPIEDRLLGQVDSSGTFSDQSSDNTSEDDWTIGTETRTTTQYRKHNKYWSTPEVVKLVEGVSKYGVGRWSGIKRMFFQSSVRRSPADLKDKWRNLLRTSSRQLRRGVDAKKKHGVRSIPHEVLNRVRELAVIYPYSRQRRARVLPTVLVASSSKVEFDNQCFSMNEQDALNFTY